MDCTLRYASPLGTILLASDGAALVGLWFEGQRHFARGLDSACKKREPGQSAVQAREIHRSGGNLPPQWRLVGAAAQVPPTGSGLEQAARWLDIYFSGRDPGFAPPLSLRGTAFERSVWAELMKIPFGQTATYGAIAARLGLPRGAARAVGGAVGRNPVSLVVPCHRVVGANGRLTGYAGGLERKRFLLALEGVIINKKDAIK